MRLWNHSLQEPGKIKEDKEFTDYDALDTIGVGICGGDGIGPIITKESERVICVFT